MSKGSHNIKILKKMEWFVRKTQVESETTYPFKKTV